MDAVIEHYEAVLPHGITLACHAAGPKDAPVLVFLHGFPEAAFVWDDLLRHFGARYRCVAPNLRGYAGSSSPVEVEAYKARHLLQDLVALIESLGAPIEALVAHDWGGAVAWNLGIQRPELARHLVMINSPHPGPFLRDLQSDPGQQAASAYMNFLCRPDAEALLAENDFARLWPFFRNMGGEAWLTEALQQQYRAVWSQGLTGPLNYYRASPLRPATADDPGTLMTIRFEPAQITVRMPTTVIWGEADIALPARLLDGLGQWVPRMRVVRVPDASHWIVHEQPARVMREIEAALAS